MIWTKNTARTNFFTVYAGISLPRSTHRERTRPIPPLFGEVALSRRRPLLCVVALLPLRGLTVGVFWTNTRHHHLRFIQFLGAVSQIISFPWWRREEKRKKKWIWTERIGVCEKDYSILPVRLSFQNDFTSSTTSFFPLNSALSLLMCVCMFVCCWWNESVLWERDWHEHSQGSWERSPK